MKILIITGIAFLIAVCWMIYMILNAPSGDEDENGFHYTDED